MSKKVSIIVPAYNSEKFIEKCINTVAEQTYKEFEMIIINDGSTDSTLDIINKCVEKYDWLRVITIENHGQGYARNLGIKEAKGDYILFLDSDDLLKQDTLEKTVSKIEKNHSDLVMFDWERYSNEDNKVRKASKKAFFNKNVLTGKDCIDILQLKAYYTVASLYSRKFLVENDIKYAEGHIYEDNVFVVKVATRANKISFIKEPLYIVVSNDESDTQTSYDTDKHPKAYIEAIKECTEVLNDSEYSPNEYYDYYTYALNKFLFYYRKRTPKSEKNNFIKEFIDVMSTQEIDYSDNEDKNPFLEYIVDNKIFSDKKYNEFRKIIIKQRIINVKNKFIIITKRKLKTIHKVIIKEIYYSNLKKKINEKSAFIQSKNGSDLAGNMFYTLKELEDEYDDFKIYLAYNKDGKDKIKKMLKKYDIDDIILIRTGTIKFFKVISRVKYLFTDTSINPLYIKRDNQVLVNTWHGTPLKKMGRDVPYRLYDCGNVQKNFIISDYLLYPNTFMEDKMLDAYNIRNITNAKVMNAGYPRNSIFYNEKRREKIRKKENIDDMQVMVYMPTWRGIMTQKENDRQISEIQGFFDEIDESLTDKQVLYIKLHVYVKSGIDCSKYKHIKEFPSGYETYDFLNTADILITDYSSVFFDFANSRRKIILFAYDEEDYFKQRGVYIDYHKDLPFEKVYTVKELIKSINSKEKVEYKDFIKKYCEFDEDDAPEHICEFLVEGKKSDKVKIDENFGKNGKKNIGIYIEKKSDYDTVNAYNKILKKLDMKENNYIFLVKQRVLKDYVKFVENIPNEIFVLPIKKNINLTFTEVLKNKFNKNSEKKQYIYEREAKTRFGNFKFDSIINISNDEEMTKLLECLSKTTLKNSL